MLQVIFELIRPQLNAVTSYARLKLGLVVLRFLIALPWLLLVDEETTRCKLLVSLKEQCFDATIPIVQMDPLDR